jgi:hypothetical protein
LAFNFRQHDSEGYGGGGSPWPASAMSRSHIRGPGITRL